MIDYVTTSMDDNLPNYTEANTMGAIMQNAYMNKNEMLLRDELCKEMCGKYACRLMSSHIPRTVPS